MRNYLVIGGSSGIGKAIVEKLSRIEKTTVFTSYFAHPIDFNSDNIYSFKFNVQEDNLSLQNLPDEIHGFVYCPGSIDLKPFKRLTKESVLDDFKLQVLGAVTSIQAILPRLNAAENASVVLFSSVAVQYGFNFHSQIAMSKGALEGLTKSLAAEFAPSIRVNCIAPSLTETPLAERLLNTDEKKKSNAERHPLKRIGEPEDIAEMAIFLLTQDSKWITGQIMKIDGGMSSIKM